MAGQMCKKETKMDLSKFVDRNADKHLLVFFSSSLRKRKINPASSRTGGAAGTSGSSSGSTSTSAKYSSSSSSRKPTAAAAAAAAMMSGGVVVVMDRRVAPRPKKALPGNDVAEAGRMSTSLTDLGNQVLILHPGKSKSREKKASNGRSGKKKGRTRRT